MLAEAPPALVEACKSTAQVDTVSFNYKSKKKIENNENSAHNRNQPACHAYKCNTHAISKEKPIFNKKYSLLSGVHRSGNQLKCVLSRQLRFERHRKRRKSKSAEKKSSNNNSNNNKFGCNMRTTCARYGGIRRRRICALSCQMTSGSGSCFNETATATATATAASLMPFADYIDNGMLHEARNNNCLRAEARATPENAFATTMVCTLPPSPTTTTTTTRLMLQLVKCNRWLGKRRMWAALSGGARQEQTTCSYVLSSNQQQQKSVKQQFPTPATASALSSPHSTDGERMRLEEQAKIHEQKELIKQAQQQQQHCLLLQIQRQEANNVQHRSWRNLIGYVAARALTRTPPTGASVINTITTTTTANKLATNATNSTSPATAPVTAKICTQKLHVQATADITTTKATTTTMPPQHRLFHRGRLAGSCIASATHKSKCRSSSSALTSALRATVTTTTITTTTKRTLNSKIATEKIKLAESRTKAVVFGDVLTLVFGVLTLHATD